MAKIGIIGGSGLENPQFLKGGRDVVVRTPYGEPSSPFAAGKLEGVEVAILSRHGRKHTIPPTQVNCRANIHAFKELGCTHILATTACGSLREDIRRGDLVIPDQFIDFTRSRPLTFFEKFDGGPDGTKHTAMPDPFNEDLRRILIETGRELKIRLHDKGTIVTIEGPRFSTRAESRMFRLWGADVINMSVAPEAILANEAELPYAAVALSTDYDCWKTDEAPVTMADILTIFARNVANVTKLLLAAIPKITGL